MPSVSELVAKAAEASKRLAAQQRQQESDDDDDDEEEKVRHSSDYSYISHSIVIDLGSVEHNPI